MYRTAKIEAPPGGSEIRIGVGAPRRVRYVLAAFAPCPGRFLGMKS